MMPFRCLLCECEKSREIVSASAVAGDKMEMFNYGLCYECGSLSILLAPCDLSQYYDQYYSLQAQECKLNIAKKAILRGVICRRGWTSHCCAALLKSRHDFPYKSLMPLHLQPNSRILDLGSGSGQFVRYLSALGFESCTGVDPYIPKDIVWENGAKIVKGTVSDIDGYYDLVTLHHSLEHMRDPYDVLMKIGSILNPNGRCLVRVPNADSLGFQWNKANWFSIQAPLHLFLPGSKGMACLSRRAGFEIVERRTEQKLEFLVFSLAQKLGIKSYFNFNTTKDLMRECTKIAEISGLPLPCLRELKKKNRILRKNGQGEWANYYLKIKS